MIDQVGGCGVSGFIPKLNRGPSRLDNGKSAVSMPGHGSEWKREVKSRYAAKTRVWIAGGEMLSQKENRVELDPEVKDKWGIPVLRKHFKHQDNHYKVLADFQEKAEELFHKPGGETMPGFGLGTW